MSALAKVKDFLWDHATDIVIMSGIITGVIVSQRVSHAAWPSRPGVPIWVWIIYILAILLQTGIKFRRKEIGGPLSITLMVFSAILSYGIYLVILSHIGTLIASVPILMVMSLSSMLLDTWAKRSWRNQQPNMKALKAGH